MLSTLWSIGRPKFHINKVSFLTEHHAMKAYWESGGIAPLIL
jgi:hypothetical protein